MTREDMANLYRTTVPAVRNAEPWVQLLVHNAYLAGMQDQLRRSIEWCDAEILKHQLKLNEMKKKFEMDPVPSRQNAIWEFQALRDVAQAIKKTIVTEV